MKIPPAQGTAQSLAAALLVILVLAAAGCREGGPVTAERIEDVSGREQTGLPGAFLPEPLVVQVVGAPGVDFLGRREAPRPAAGVTVTFRVDLGRRTPRRDEAEPADERAAPPEERDPADLPPHPLLHAAPPATEPRPDAAAAEPGKPPPAGGLSLTAKTDANGLARAFVRLGRRSGDWEVEAVIPAAPAQKADNVRFRFACGVEKETPVRESVAGATVPIRLRLMKVAETARSAGGAPGGDGGPDRDRDGEDEKAGPGSSRNSTRLDLVPLPDRRVVFGIVGTPRGGEDAQLRNRRGRTADDGWRETFLTLGSEPGVYHVLAEMEPQPGDEPMKGVLFSIVAMDWVKTGLQLAAGVLVFVIGVRLLGSGFLLLTSPYMHLPTGKWAVSRFQGYAGGVLTGAIFESSSLVTSYLASFANGGLLTASGALGLILGANLGSTLLPQILSLRVAWLTAPFLAAGTLLLLLPRRANLGSWGWVFLGAGLVLVGWEVLAESAGLAALSHTFRDEFLFAQVDYGLAFSRYAARFLAYFFTGALAAFLLRTSNLIVVIAMLLAASGTIQVPTAVPLVLGANLGSAAMVFALSLRKRREAKRLALSNLLVQVFGCAGAVVLSLIPIGGRTPFIWLIESVSPARAVADLSGNVATQVACAHTLYNLAAGWVFLAFPWALLGPLDRLLPGAGASADLKPYLLDRNLISVPSLALRQATEEVVYLTEVCRKTTAEAFDSFRYNDLSLSEQVLRRGEVITGIHREVIQYLVAISENQLARRDATQLKVLQTAADSLARIGEQGERLRDLAARKIEERIGGHEEVDRDLTEAYDLVLAQFANILTLLRHHDPKTEESAVKLVERLAKFSTRIEGQWRQRLETPGSPPAPMSIHLQAVLYQEAFGILFRIAAHLAHIAQSMRILAPERM